MRLTITRLATAAVLLTAAACSSGDPESKPSGDTGAEKPSPGGSGAKKPLPGAPDAEKFSPGAPSGPPDQASRQGFGRQRVVPQDQPAADVRDDENIAGDKDFELQPPPA